MILYHGSPLKLNKLIPKRAKGETKFENLKAVFLVDDLLYASLYAIAKTLKGKTSFGITSRKVIVVGDFLKELKPGYVHEIHYDKPIKGDRGQYAILEEVIPNKIIPVYPRDYLQYFTIIYDKYKLFDELYKLK